MAKQRLEYHRAWRAKNHEKDKAYNRKSYAKNRTKILERKRAYYRTGKTRNRVSEKSRGLKFAYGMSLEAYNLLLCQQGNKCSICGASPKKKSLCVDHNHSNGQIRELLCDNCNMGIGKFKHDPKLLAAAIKYLEQWT